MEINFVIMLYDLPNFIIIHLGIIEARHQGVILEFTCLIFVPVPEVFERAGKYFSVDIGYRTENWLLRQFMKLDIRILKDKQPMVISHKNALWTVAGDIPVLVSGSIFMYRIIADLEVALCHTGRSCQKQEYQ